MVVYRITAPSFADEPLSGRGAGLYGGRWNPKGLQVVYASSSLSLAILETLVHTGTRVLPAGLYAHSIVVPPGITPREIQSSELPGGWRRHPPPKSLQQIGRDWIHSRQTVILSVPSAVVPSEANFLLDPGHPDFRRVKVLSTHPLDLDLRLSG